MGMEYVTSAPQVEYISAAPAMEYVTAAPQVEYVTAAPAAVEYLSAPEVIRPAPVQKTDPTVSRNLLAMGNVVSERVVSPEELFQDGRFFEAEAERAPAERVSAMFQSAPVVQAAPVVYERMQPQMVEYVSQAAPVVYETMQPQMVEYVQGAPFY